MKLDLQASLPRPKKFNIKHGALKKDYNLVIENNEERKRLNLDDEEVPSDLKGEDEKAWLQKLREQRLEFQNKGCFNRKITEDASTGFKQITFQNSIKTEGVDLGSR